MIALLYVQVSRAEIYLHADERSTNRSISKLMSVLKVTSLSS